MTAAAADLTAAAAADLTAAAAAAADLTAAGTAVSAAGPQEQQWHGLG